MLQKILKSTFVANVFLRTWSFKNVFMIYWSGCRVEELNDEKIVVSLPLNRRTKNHLNSLYFGAFAIGADVAGGLLAMKEIQRTNGGVSLVFKDLQASFLKRSEGKTIFVCKDGAKIRNLVKLAIDSNERQEASVEILAYCPSKLKDEVVAKFNLTLSLKKKK